MSTLFTISKSWHDSYWLYERLGFAKAGDAILLIEDAVLATHSAMTLASFVAKCAASDVSTYVLQDDLLLRGLDNQYAMVNEVDYEGFVRLIVQYDKQVSW